MPFFYNLHSAVHNPSPAVTKLGSSLENPPTAHSPSMGWRMTSKHLSAVWRGCGRQVMAGVANQSEATAKHMQVNEWLRTGAPVWMTGWHLICIRSVYHKPLPLFKNKCTFLAPFFFFTLHCTSRCWSPAASSYLYALQQWLLGIPHGGLPDGDNNWLCSCNVCWNGQL